LKKRGDKVSRFLKKLDRKQSTDKLWNSYKGEDPKIFRKRKTKSCYCGWHSQGKETFNPDQTKHWKKNKYMFWRRLLKAYRIKEKEKHEKNL